MRCRACLLLLALPRAGSLAQRADRAAVVKLYHLLNGPWWHRNANWDVDKGDPCAYAHDHNLQEPWDGIHCLDPCSLHIDGLECYSGRITVIHLERNNLTGSITNWTEVGALTNLTTLNLRENHISGTLPGEIGGIMNLVDIDFSRNKLQGTIPTEIGTINANGGRMYPGGQYTPEWGGYKMSSADLEDKRPPRILNFDLSHNELEGTLPTQMGKVNTELLALHDNRISGTLPQQFANLTWLQHWDMRNNRIGGSLPTEIQKLRELRFLDLSDNRLSGPIPPGIVELDELEDLQLSTNNLTGDLPPELGKLTSLVYLRLYNNALTADLSRHGSIGELEQLEVLDLYNNSMVGDMPPQFANLKSLKYLYLQNEHYWPLRHFYCRQRLPKATWGKGGTKYNWVVVAQMYETMTTSTVQGDRRCIDPHDTTFAFNSLQDSGVLAMG